VFLDNRCGPAINLSIGGDLPSAAMNNTIVGGTAGIAVSGSFAAVRAVRNNIITGADYGILGYYEAAPDHNLVWGNATNYAGTLPDQTGTNGNISNAPLFLDPAGGNYGLQATSPGVDVGSAEGAPTTDALGRARPVDGPDADVVAQFDMGAFERDGTEPPPVPQGGTLDRTFALDGSILLGTPYDAAMAHDAQDRLVAASYSWLGRGQMRVERFEADGTPSPDFGTNGALLRNFVVGGTSFPTHIEPTGTDLLVVGEYYGSTARLGIARLKENGTYDPTFSGDGRATYKVFTAEHDVISAFRVSVLAGGKIGLAVAAFDYDAHDVLQFTGQSLLRLNANGSADSSFSGDARMSLTADYSDVAFLANGGAYVGRKVGVTHEVRKLTPSGAADTTFSGDGKTSVSCSAHRGALLSVDLVGRPVLMCVRESSPTLNLGIFRFTTAGAPDPSYSGDGKTAMVLTGGSSSSVVLQFDDSGLPWAAIRSATDVKSFLVFTLDASGAPNPAWSGDGKSSLTVPRTVALAGLEKSGNRLYVELYHYPTPAYATVYALVA
ncbi:MAG: choice-of-anchor Q domain-containing protein, partial [Acidimicrobiales bacterium]